MVEAIKSAASYLFGGKEEKKIEDEDPLKALQ